MTTSLTEIQRQLLGAFFEESFEGIERLEAGLLRLERAPDGDRELINDIFRVAHSIKGGAGSFGLHAVGELGHAMETLLDRYRAGTLSPTSEGLALLLEAVDVLKELLAATRDGQETPQHAVDALCQRLVAFTGGSVEAPRGAQPVKASEMRDIHVRFAPKPKLLETGNEPVRLLRELSRLGSISVRADLSQLPPLESLDPGLCYLAFDIELSGTASDADVAEVFSWVEGDADVLIETVHNAAEPTNPTATSGESAPLAAGPALSPAPAAATALAGRAESDGGLGSIRVSVDKIDLLMNMVGELVITQSMLGEIEGDGKLDAARIERLREGLGLLARNTRSLQESVMRLRSMPISIVFSRFPRLVHDLGRQLNKQIELKIVGQTTELDKTVLEKLGDPLVHLVRNSIDHGIESPEARRAAGKPEIGVLELRAYHRGGDIVVEVVDDGKGIDTRRVLERARSVGLVGPDETPTEDVIRNLIFAPGFSTASSVTDISGRGVGMDVVRSSVKSLGGDVSLDSTPGKGTRISLRLPLTLAIIDGQLIRVGSHSYVIPLLSIVESVQVEPRRVSRFQGRQDIYRLRDELIPMVDLGRVLGLAGNSEKGDESLMVIVEADGEHVGLLVNELLAQQQVVVKSLETNYSRVEGLAGATILGDGSVAFILDVAGIGRLIRGPRTRDGARAA